MDIPDNILDSQKYRTARTKADEIYGPKTSAYKNMYMSKLYKDLGGRYRGKKTKSLPKWRKEQWVQVEEYVKEGKKVPCGEDGRAKAKACRPLKKLDGTTSITLQDALKKHGRKKILELAQSKQKDMSGRVNWNAGTFKPSK